MKKTLSLIIVFALLISLSIQAFAASAGISADKSTLKKGETVTVTLSLSAEMKNITNFEYSIYYDSELFTLKSSEVGNACAQTQLSKQKTDAKGSFYSVSFVDTASEGVTVKAGTLYTLRFEAAKAVSAAASASFELSQVSVMNTSWTQVPDAVLGIAKLNVTVNPESAENGLPLTLTISAPASVKKQAGTAFNALVYSTEWDGKDYKLLDCVVNIPDGLKVESVTAGDRLTGGELSWNTDSENKLRIVYNDANTMSTLALEGSDFPAVLFIIGLQTTNQLSSASATISLGGASLKLDADSEKAGSMSVFTLADTADEQGNTAEAKIGFTGTGGSTAVTVTAGELFAGDGIDLIPDNKKAVAVSVSGLGKNNMKLTYKKTGTSIDMLYSGEISALTGTACYVAVVDKDTPITDFAKWANYAADVGKRSEEIVFGDTNKDGIVNAQDALNIINAWIRKTELGEDNDYLRYNVNSDSRINTFDTLGVEEAFVNSRNCKLVTRAAALVSGG